jgi:hypothetical protein
MFGSRFVATVTRAVCVTDTWQYFNTADAVYNFLGFWSQHGNITFACCSSIRSILINPFVAIDKLTLWHASLSDKC